MADVFSQYAAKYWAKGISVIPLMSREKRPFQDGWSQWHDHLPSADMQATWLRQFIYHNMGMVLGKQSNVSVVDIDSDDPRVMEVLDEILPKSPWVRIGQKGAVLAYRYSGVGTFRIDDENGVRLLEHLSSGTQVVLPPSIHPNTQQPYIENVSLLDVHDVLPSLVPDVEQRIRDGLIAKGFKLRSSGGKGRYQISEKISAGARDTKMNQAAGAEACAVLRGEITLLQAISNIRGWYETKVEHKAGDDIDIDKGVQQIVQYLLSDVNTKNRILPSGWDEGLTEENKKDWGLLFSEDQEEWTVQQLLDYMHKTFSVHAPGDPASRAAAEFIVNKLSKSIKLTGPEIEEVLKKLKDGTNLSIKVYKDRIKELQAGSLKGENQTEIAEAVIKDLEKRGYDLRFQNNEWWTWEGTHWATIDEDVIWKIVAKDYGNFSVSKKAGDHSGILKIMSKLVDNKIKRMDVDGVNFRNGFLTTDLQLIPHEKDHGMTYVMHYEYNPELAGKAFKFEDLLRQCWGHHADYEDQRKALQEAMAVTLFGKGPSFQRAFLLFGVARSGKSQVLEIITNLVPDEAKCSVPPTEWDKQFSLAFLHEKILNVVGELDKKKFLPDKEFKQLVDGTPLTAQHKFKNLFTFEPKAAHWIASNHLPRTSDTSDAFNRRWLIFLFDKPVPPSQQVVDLGKIIVAEEIDAIAAWAIQAYPNLVKRGLFTIPASHLQYEDTMAQKNSNIRAWLADKVIEKTDARTKEDVLYTNFWEYVGTNSLGKVQGRKEFSTDLQQILAELGRNCAVFADGFTVYTNLAIKDKK